ncbi:MAG: hypothetical protein JXM71_06420 [Spirochaetales bacterium]|nr:hypothetical protein [Spirochaetales bacterium]
MKSSTSATQNALARVTIVLTLALISTIALSCDNAESAPAAKTPAPAPASVEPEPDSGFVALTGPAPESGYAGSLVAYTRWEDASGDNLVVLSKETAETGAVLHAYHFRGTSDEPVWTHEDGAWSCEQSDSAAVAEAGFYRDGVWADDYDGDGLGEAMFAYRVDCSAGTGPFRLELLVVGGPEVLAMHGTTRVDPVDAPRTAASVRHDDSMAAAPESLRSEAQRLWNDAQFDLAVPAAYPGFYDYMRYDGVVLRGENPPWALELLPQYMILDLFGDAARTAISYDSITPGDGELVIEGSGKLEAWDHGFRVRIIENPTPAPDGKTYEFEAVVEWSDGTRRTGWGGASIE